MGEVLWLFSVAELKNEWDEMSSCWQKLTKGWRCKPLGRWNSASESQFSAGPVNIQIILKCTKSLHYLQLYSVLFYSIHLLSAFFLLTYANRSANLSANLSLISLFNQYLNRDITFSIASLKRALQKQNLTIQSYT